jgi:arsenate reductase
LIANWDLPENLILVDIKKDMYSQDDIDTMFALTGSYEQLFSKRSQNFVAQGLKNSIISDADYGTLLPQDYTFLKRPILVYDENIFVGNDAKTEAEVKSFLEKL